MQKLLKIKINLFVNSFQGVPSQVVCSKLGTFMVLVTRRTITHKIEEKFDQAMGVQLVIIFLIFPLSLYHLVLS